MSTEQALTSIHISSKSHLNLSFNLNQCGEGTVAADETLHIAPDDSFTLLCMDSGSAQLETSGLGFPMRAPQGFFSFPDLSYVLHNNSGESLHVTWIRFSGYSVENYLNRANITRTHPVFPDDEREVCTRMARMYQAAQKLPNRYCRMASILYDIFSLLLDRDHAKEKVDYVDDANFYAVKAAEFIERHYMQSINVDDIAKAIGVSRKHLYSVFCDTMKISPKQYLIYYRIEKAGRHLKLSTQSIQEIAESVGYSNQFYFAKEFKRLTGVTPSEYRRNPDSGDVFSYRSFAPVLQERLHSPSVDLPVGEAILSVQSSKNGDRGAR